jgi:hypothetical protein
MKEQYPAEYRRNQNIGIQADIFSGHYLAIFVISHMGM